jgi:hypothetical protein
MTKSLIEQDGSFVQGFGDDTPVPPEMMTAGRSVVLSAPDNAGFKWNGSAWVGSVPVVAPPLTADQLATILIAKAGVPLSSQDVAMAKAQAVSATVDTVNSGISL